MITIEQIKAARALLKWKQSDLAKFSGVSIPAIARIEMNKGNPRQKTIMALRNAFETSGIEFLGAHGVDQRQDHFSVETLYGKNSIIGIWADIEKTCGGGQGGELLVSNLDERLFIQLYPQQMKDTLQRRQKLGITTRALVKEDENFFLMPLDWHRAVPSILFTQILYMVYGDTLIIIDFKQSPRFIRIQNRSLAQSFRQQFEFNWSIGKTIDAKKATLWQL